MRLHLPEGEGLIKCLPFLSALQEVEQHWEKRLRDGMTACERKFAEEAMGWERRIRETDAAWQAKVVELEQLWREWLRPGLGGFSLPKQCCGFYKHLLSNPFLSHSATSHFTGNQA